MVGGEMEFKKASQRNYQFKVNEAICYDSDEVMIYDGTAYFKKSIFKTHDQCKQWFQDNVENSVMKFDKTKAITKVLHGIKASTGTPTETEWNMIKPLMVNTDEFTIDDIKVYHPILANNFIDKDEERFEVKMLNGFAKTIIDKPMIFDHDGKGEAGKEGRFFNANVRKISQEEMKVALGPYPYKGLDALLQEVEEDDKGLYVLDTAFFMLKDNVQLIRKIDAGIIKDMSIRFRAERREAIKDDEGELKYFVYRGAGEALEGSLVWLGAQYGAQAKKGFNAVPGESEGSDDDPLNQNSEVLMKFESKALGIEIEIDGDDLSAIEKEVEPKVQALLDQKAALETDLETVKAEKDEALEGVEDLLKSKEILDAIQKVFGEDFDSEKAEAIKTQAEARHTEMVEKAIKFGSLIGVIEKDQVEAKRTEYAGLSYEAIEEKANEYEVISKSKAGLNRGQLDDDSEHIELATAVPISDSQIFN